MITPALVALAKSCLDSGDARCRILLVAHVPGEEVAVAAQEVVFNRAEDYLDAVQASWPLLSHVGVPEKGWPCE